MVQSFEQVRAFRRKHNDSYNFNWLLRVPYELQQPFVVRTPRCARWNCTRAQPLHLLASNLRRAFSGIVTGNVKENGVAAIERLGPYELSGDPISCGCWMNC